jgi:HSP20 family protein
MARADVALKRTDTIDHELERLHEEISRRAYELFKSNGMLSNDPIGDWLNAERELVWSPAIEVRQKDSQFEVLAATPGVEAKDLDVQITPNDLLIKAESNHRNPATEGDVRVCEFTGGKLFRSVHFPEAIDPNSVKVEYRNGLLHLTAAIKKVQPRKVDIKAA